MRDLEARFCRHLNLSAMRGVPVQMVIGAEDTETWEITIGRDSPLWIEGANDVGETRLERLQALRASFEHAGIRVRYDVVPGVGHLGYPLLPAVKRFFAADVLVK